MEELRYDRQVTGEITFGPFGNTLTTPCDEYIFGQSGVGILHFDIGKLYPAFGELLDQILQVAL